MRPEYPHWFDIERATIMRLDDAYTQEWANREQLPCGMLHLGQPCGNDAHFIIAYPRPQDGLNSLAVCQDCANHIELTGDEITAYWREKQREWGVR